MKDIVRNPRNQIIFILLLLSGSGAYFWDVMRYQLRLQEIETLALRDRNLTRANELARRAVGGEGMERVRRAIAAYDRQAAGVRYLLPTDSVNQPLIPQISRAADAFDVQITAFTPDAPVTGEKYDTERYQLSVEGRYHDIGAFLAALGSFDRIVRVRKYEWTVLNTQDANTSSSNGRRVGAKMLLETYVAGTATPMETAVSDTTNTRPTSTYTRDEKGVLWQMVQVPGKPNPVRIPVTAAGRAAAQEWLRRNPQR